MGVFLLRSYCEQKDLFKHVNLPLQHQHTGKPRIVVFDAAGALRSFLRPGKKALLYDFHHQQSRVRSLVRAFKQAGFELVVFLDLSIPSDKLTTWYRRRVVDAATLKKLNQQLASTAGKPNLPESLWIPPNGATQLLGDAFQEAGCRVFYSFDDTDKEAAFWAKKNKAYAVITDDTDFMCYEGVDRIWSANIRLPSSRAMPNKAPVIRVMELLRTRLLSSLGLNQVQLQQLAGLLGNDHIKHIAKEDLHALREAHPGQHVVAVLAKQVLQLQPALGGGSSIAAAANGFVAAHGPVLPEVKALVAAAVKAVGGSAAAEPPSQADGKAAKQGGKGAGSSSDSAAAAGANGSAEAAADAPAAARGSSTDPIVARLVNRAVAKVVTAAEQGLDLEDLTEADLDAFLEGEEFEVSHPRGEEEEADESAEGQAGTAAAAAAPADSAATQVERCKRAMQQYSLKGAASPVVAGSGDRWLLLKRQILMKSVGLEDMSKTPAHVLLQPLRLAVYAALSLGKVTEYMCVLDEQWRSWANGRVVEVPAPPPKREKRGSKRGGGKAAADGHVHVAVKKLVAAVFAKILGAEQPAAAEGTSKAADEAAAAAAEDGAAKPTAEQGTAAAAAEEAPAAAATAAAAPEEDAKNNSAAAADEAAAADAAALADGIEPAVRKLVSGAIAKAVAAANRAAARANKPPPPYEQLPKPLPQKPLDLAALLVRRLRQLDRTEQQFTKAQEKLLLLQVSHRHSVLTAMRGAHAQVQAVRIPDLHAANLFLQAYSMLHTAADGKVPRITALLHVEAFHALCQHPALVTKVQNSPSDAELAKHQGRGAGPAVSAAAAAAAAAAASAAGQGFRGGLKPGMGPGRGLVQPYAQQYGMQQQPRGFRGGPGGGYGPGRGGRGDAAPGAHPPGPGYQQGDHHGGGFRSRDANFGGGNGAARGGYHPAAPVMGGGGRGGGGGYQPGPSQGHWPAPQRPQQRGEALTWQQRQNRTPAGGPAAAAAGGGYYGGAPQEGRPAAASTTSPNQPQWAGYGASGAAYGGSGGRYEGGSTGRFEGGRYEGGSSARFEGGSSGRYEGGSSGRYEGGSNARYEGGTSARYEGGSGRYEGASGGRYDSSSTGAYESSGTNASYGQGYGAASSGGASGGYRGQAAASGGYGSSSYSNSSYGAGGSGAAYGSSGYASGYGTGGSAAGSGGYGSGGYQQQQQGYGSGAQQGYSSQQYGSQQYGSGHQQPQGAGGYGGHQQYSSSAQPSGGYGAGGRGGAGGGDRGAPGGGDRGGRQHQAAAVAPASGAHSSAGLTWQQQQMVRGTGQQPPTGRGPPGAMPARQGSGGWQ